MGVCAGVKALAHTCITTRINSYVTGMHTRRAHTKNGCTHSHLRPYMRPQLPLQSVIEMLGDVNNGNMFGATFGLETASVADLPKDMLIPGVAVYG